MCNLSQGPSYRSSWFPSRFGTEATLVLTALVPPADEEDVTLQEQPPRGNQVLHPCLLAYEYINHLNSQNTTQGIIPRYVNVRPT